VLLDIFKSMTVPLLSKTVQLVSLLSHLLKPHPLKKIMEKGGSRS